MSSDMSKRDVNGVESMAICSYISDSGDGGGGSANAGMI